MLRQWWRAMRAATALAGAAAVITAGCGSTGPAAGDAEKTGLPREVTAMQHEEALRHFIDGSVFEMKGEYAQAALEYQEALRYEKNHAMFFALAKCYSALNKSALAIEAGREAVRLAPENYDYRRLLAEVMNNAFDFDGAAEQYEALIARDSSRMDAWYNLARVYQNRKPLKALDIYWKMTARFGPEWEVLLQTAELCSKLGKHDSAASALRQMTELDPGNRELKRTLAHTYLRAEQLNNALAVYSVLHEIDSSNLEYQAEIAGIWLQKKEYDRATREFETILGQDTLSVDVKVHIGELYFDQLQKDSTLIPVSRRIFERIRDAHPDDWRPYWFLGGIASAEQDDSLTVLNFRKVTELASWNANGWVFLSAVYLNKNNFAASVPILESAVRAVPDDFRVNFFLGVAYSRVGRNEDAARVLERARQINPKDVDAIGQLALVYEGLKKLDESDSLYEEALRINPDNHLILNNYGYSLAERGIQLDRALDMARKAVEAQPDNTSYLDTIGWVYFRLGRYREAEQYISKAIAKGDASAVILEHLGDVYFKLNETERAVEQWNAALKLDANNTGLREKIARRSL
ncbi:MAG: tetratricopeptide repeat protein [Bacteroidota bacterium]